MKFRRMLTVLLALAMMLTLTACGGASKDTAVGGYMADAPAAEMAPADSLTSANNANSSALPENRKWIITVDMSVETDDLDTMLESLDGHILSLNGYVENQNIYNGSSHSSRRYRSASLTVRIPAEDVDRFTEKVTGICNVVNSGTNKQDVTLTYVDIESRKTALEAEEARLLELMAKAATLNDLLTIEKRLTDVRTELEKVTSALKVFDNQVDYATVHLSIDEVKEYTEVTEPETVWQRIGSGFKKSLKGVWNFLTELFVFLIVALPYAVMLAVPPLLIIFLIRLRNRRRRNRKNK